MPSSSAMTYEGSAPATSVTKSHSPRSMTLSTTSRAMSVMRSLSFATWRGLKPLLTRARSAVCRGGSIVNINTPRWSAMSSGPGTSKYTPVASDDHVALSRDTAKTSSRPVSARNPGPSLYGCHATGAQSRSFRNASKGIPARYVSGSVRSTPPMLIASSVTPHLLPGDVVVNGMVGSAGGGRGLVQGLVDVGDDVVDVLDADGGADRLRPDTGLHQLLVGQLAVGGGGRMDGQGLGVSQIEQPLDEL